ncbi:MAG: ATP-binding protein [bacterium]
MNIRRSPTPGSTHEDIPALIETLLDTEQRLEELTAGEVDTVAGRDGRTFLLRRAQEQLRHSEARKQAAILNALPAHVALLDAQGIIISVNEAWRRFADANHLRHQACGIGLNYLEVCDRSRGDGAADGQQVAAAVRSILAGKALRFSIEYACHADAEHHWFLFTVAPLAEDHRNGAVVMHVDVTERREVEESLQLVHKQLLVASRQAGMAEVATGVLHNVGNVLNSVNVSATLIANQVHHSKAADLAKVCVLLEQHQADLGAFLTTDPKGRIIPTYLGRLVNSLDQERKVMSGELDNLRNNIEHIKDVMAMQQDYATMSASAETVCLPDLLDDALRMSAGSLARHDIEVVRDYQTRPVLRLDKHQVIQILVNLIRNAGYACDESARADKAITLRITGDDQRVRIAVGDNGIGILPQNLTRIFEHGFTTRKRGHGFGLHKSAIAAHELGGALTVHSDGAERGATFSLELPRGAPGDTDGQPTG